MTPSRLARGLLGALLALGLGTGCGGPEDPATEVAPPLAPKLIFYSWAQDMPRSVLDAFTAEYGVEVVYPTYESTEEAVANLRAGEVYDVVVVDNDFVPDLVAEGLLAEIDPQKVPNVRNISANFRDLVFDPGNRFSVTFNWGLTGLITRADGVSPPARRWSDLWDPRYKGQVLVWELQRYLLAVVLKSLGYSINSVDPQELEAALGRLLALKERAHSIPYLPEVADQALANGDLVLMTGWAGDVLRARARGLQVHFALPAEGTIQWADNFIIPCNSPRRRTAEVFINFLLRPEISAQIVNEQYYATANEAALPLIRPKVLNDPVIFPPREAVQQAEVLMPLSPEGKALRERIWRRYLDAPPSPGVTDP